MKLKTIKVEGERTESTYNGRFDGYQFLYPEGTKRIVRAYFLFPKTIDGKTRRGIQIVEQRASIYNPTGFGRPGPCHNLWNNTRFIDSSLLESTLETEKGLMNR